MQKFQKASELTNLLDSRNDERSRVLHTTSARRLFDDNSPRPSELQRLTTRSRANWLSWDTRRSVVDGKGVGRLQGKRYAWNESDFHRHFFSLKKNGGSRQYDEIPIRFHVFVPKSFLISFDYELKKNFNVIIFERIRTY